MGTMSETGGTCTAGLDDFVKRAVELLLLKEEMRVKGNLKGNGGKHLKLYSLKSQNQQVWKNPSRLSPQHHWCHPPNHVPKSHIQTPLTHSQIWWQE